MKRVVAAVTVLLASVGAQAAPVPPSCPYGREVQDNTVCVDDAWDFYCVVHSEPTCGFDSAFWGWPLLCQAGELYYETGPVDMDYNCYGFSALGCTGDVECFKDPDHDMGGDDDGCVTFSESDGFFLANGWTVSASWYRECHKRKTCILGEVAGDGGTPRWCMGHAISEVCDSSGGGWWESKTGNEF